MKLTIKRGYKTGGFMSSQSLYVTATIEPTAAELDALEKYPFDLDYYVRTSLNSSIEKRKLALSEWISAPSSFESANFDGLDIFEADVKKAAEYFTYAMGRLAVWDQPTTVEY